MDENWLDAIALKIRPQIQESTGLERASRLLDTSALLGYLPFALIGVLWLISSTDLNLDLAAWLGLAIIFILLALFGRYPFELRLQLTRSRFANNTGSLQPLVSWSGALMFGPIAIWPEVLLDSGLYVYRWWRESSVDNRWNIARNYVQVMSTTTIARLLGLTAYEWLGGAYPLSGLSWVDVWPAAILATLAYFLAALLLIAPFGKRAVQMISISLANDVATPSSITRFMLAGLILSYASLPFAILAAGLYGAYGFTVYLVLMAGAFLASLLASRLSQSDQYSQQRSKEMSILESLGRAIIDSPPNDPATLPQLLADHVEGMFMRSLTTIWLYPETTLYQTADVAEFPHLQEARTLAKQGSDPYYQVFDIRLPDETFGSLVHNGLIVPIVENSRILGAVFVLKREDFGDVMDYLAAVQSLAAQTASALRRFELYEQMLESEKMARELEVAGHIQASFLPDKAPALDGWDIWAVLQPARQTSGDFYDFVDLGNGRLGLIVADVADKGTGAALYMALSRTLIRTYAKQNPFNPELALQTTNDRIMEDTGSDQFVTVFLGILDAAAGQLIYANAGHNPAFLISTYGQDSPQKLSHTGIPLGMFKDMSWRQKNVNLNPGDLLVMYTDGVTEAQNAGGEEYGERRLLDLVADSQQNSHAAPQIASHILNSISQFTAETPQLDDITLMILQRSLPFGDALDGID